MQAMQLACYTRRQIKTQELNLETVLERELEGAALLGVELAAPAAVVHVEQFFVPLQRTMAAPATDNIKASFPDYAWVNADLPGRTLLDPMVE